MAFQGMQFPVPQQQIPFYEAFNNQQQHHQNMQKGEMDLHQSQASNFIKDLEAQYKEQEIMRDLELKHQMALHHAAQAKNAEKGEHQYAPTEPFKLQKDYKNAVKEFGPDSEEAKYFKQAMDNHLYSHGEGRFAPTKTTKIDQELAIARAKDPNSQETKNLELAANKERSDQDTRKKALAARNIEMSMDSIDPDAITMYSGPEGQLKLKQEQLMDMLGSPSPEYQRYKESVVAAKFEAKQLRQMLGESVREKVAKELEMISNPESFGTSPETAKAMLLKAREVLKRELRTFQEAQVSTEPYQGTKGKEESIKKAEASQPSQKHKAHTKEDILETARQSGKTVAEIEELIRKAEEGK
jgi:hypothetical protein